MDGTCRGLLLADASENTKAPTGEVEAFKVSTEDSGKSPVIKV
jgi:hypothetical protein